jgi:hypothetical protein
LYAFLFSQYLSHAWPILFKQCCFKSIGYLTSSGEESGKEVRGSWHVGLDHIFSIFWSDCVKARKTCYNVRSVGRRKEW